MPSQQALIAAFEVLETAGLRPPAAWADPVARGRAVDVWALVLADVTDDAIVGAAVAYLRTGAAYWPTPGQLLEQLRETPAGTDTADEWWGRLRALRVERGSTPPLRPGQPEPWTLSPSPIGARVLWAALEAIGGWAGYHERPERLGPVVGGLVDRQRAMLARYAALEAEHPGARRIRLPGEPTQAQRERIAAWLATATPERAERALAALRARHGPQDPPRDPTARVAPWRLSDDASEEARVWAALDAVGGWVAIPPRGGEEDPGIAAQRASFRLAFRSFSARTARREETQAVAALAEGIGHLRQISG